MQRTYSWCLFISMVLAILLLLAACGESGCYENRSSIPRAAFYAYNMPESTIAVDSIEVYGVGHPTDSLLVAAASGTSSLYLPFRSDADTTRYVIHYAAQALADTANNDTLTFAYTPHEAGTHVMKAAIAAEDYMVESPGFTYEVEEEKLQNNVVVNDGEGIDINVIIAKKKQ